MTSHLTYIAGLMLACLVVTAPARAESAASSASSAGSASVGSLSDSLQGSSNSSSHKTPVAEGEYRVTDIVASAGQPGMLRLTLQADAGPEPDRGFTLELPQHTLAKRPLAARDLVRVSRRPYGLEFAYADTRQAFFLALADDWLRELDPRPVTL